MIISWMTRDKAVPSAVYYGLHPYSIDKIAPANAFNFTNDGVYRFVHYVSLKNLWPAMTYCKQNPFNMIHCYKKTVNLFSTTMEEYYIVLFTNYIAFSNAIYFWSKQSSKFGNYDALSNAT